MIQVIVRKQQYQELKKKIKTILDTEGEIFKKGVKEEPTLIKPNKLEMEKYFDTEFENLEEVITAAKTFLNDGIEITTDEKGEVILDIIFAAGVLKEYGSITVEIDGADKNIGSDYGDELEINVDTTEI